MIRPRGSSADRFRRSLPHVFRSRRAATSDSDCTTAPRDRPLRTLRPYFLTLLRRHQWTIATAMFLLAVSAAARFVPPMVTRLAVDLVFGGRPVPPTLQQLAPDTMSPGGWLAMLGAAVAVSSLVSIGTSVAGHWLLIRMSVKLHLRTRRMLFERSLALPLHRFYRFKSGGLHGILRDDTAGASNLTRWIVGSLWPAALQLTACLAVLVWIDIRLLTGTIGLLPILYLSRRLWHGRMLPLLSEARRQREALDGQLAETLGGVRVVRAFNAVAMESRRHTWGNHLIARYELRAHWYGKVIELIWGAVIPAVLAALLVFGGLQVLAGRLSLGDLMLFIFCLTMLLEPVSTLANGWAAAQQSLAQINRVLDLTEEPAEVRSPHVAVAKNAIAGRLTLAGVSFQYPGSDHPALIDIDLTIEPGETVALVGGSGAGKTTLCNLVARFIRPTRGSIRIDGIALETIAPGEYREIVGIVDQDVILFDGTVAENITYGATRSPEQIRQAAEMADAHRFIAALPDGYDTFIGERGAFLSGGQRQRLALARTLLRDPRILILDEATSDLDAESELRVQHAGLTRNRTCLIIAHDFTTIREADRIIVLEGGRIVESGVPRALVAQNGRYRALLDAQLKMSADSAGLIVG